MFISIFYLYKLWCKCIHIIEKNQAITVYYSQYITVYKIILDRRPASSRNCHGPVNSCGRRTAVFSRKSACSPVLIIFYFNSGSRYQNFYIWLPTTSQYDVRSMSSSKKRFKELHWFVIVNVSWKHWFVIVNVSWKVSRCSDF